MYPSGQPPYPSQQPQDGSFPYPPDHATPGGFQQPGYPGGQDAGQTGGWNQPGGGFPGYPSDQSPYPSGQPSYPPPDQQPYPSGQPSYPPQDQQPYPSGQPSYPPSSGQSPYPPSSESSFAGYPGAGPGYPGQSMGESGFQGPTEQKKGVSLRLQAANLPSADFFSKSDPMCVVFMRGGSGTWMEIGRTEMIKDNQNPVWQKKFSVDYFQHTNQKVKFEIYDIDNNSTQLKRQDFLGEAETNLDDIIVRNNKNMTLPLKNAKSKKNPTITVTATILSKVTIRFAGHGLKNKDVFSKSDPFFMIKRQDLYKRFEVVYKSEKIDNDLNPRWTSFSMTDEQFCAGDYNCPINISVYDYDSGNNHDMIGECQTSLNRLLQMQSVGGQLDLGHRGKKCGTLTIEQATVA